MADLAPAPDPVEPLAPAQEMAPAVPEPIILSPEQADAAGLAGCQPGDTYTATLTVQSNDETGLSLEISDAQADQAPEEAGMPQMKSRVMGPEAFA